ncbi:hypothetical protein [Ornithobacterium rhinotracheale]|uniref:hypothetical protein n=1 Tax=Ornithobacterium rhinotracheale TaxID=28251 RepID=UPI0039FBE1B3
MIDGVDIECTEDLATIWESSPFLDFITKVNEKTGEIHPKKTAKYRGLIFELLQKGNGEGVFCSVRGSLHKYYNEGKHNADGFTFNALQSVILDLNKKFGIEPQSAIIRNIEFGVNLYAPEPVQNVLNGVIAYKGRRFDTLNDGRKRLGVCVPYQRYTIKLYDKGKQYGICSNLMRLEFAVHKMAHLQKYGIRSLADCMRLENLHPLGGVLADFWGDVIHLDKRAIKWREMSNFQHKKLLYYASPQNWEDFTRVQRTRAKKIYKTLVAKYCTSTKPEWLKNEVLRVWENLTQNIGETMPYDLPKTNSPKKVKNVYDLTNIINGYFVYKNAPQKADVFFKYFGTYEPEEIETHEQENNLKEERETEPPFLSADIAKGNKENHKTGNKCKKCKCCGSDISHKRAGTKYCSKKCNNKINGKKRMKAQKQKRRQENKSLDKITKLWRADKIKYLSMDIAGECVTLAPQEITTDRETINQVKKIFLHPTDGRYNDFTLTDGRARKLLRLINKYNLENCKK